MKNSNTIMALALISLFAPLAVAQANGPADNPMAEPLEVTATDHQLTELQLALPVINRDRTPVSVSWPIQAGTAVADDAQPFLQESRQYMLDTTGQALARGVTIHTTAPGALVRITPLEPMADLDIQTSDILVSQGKNQWRGSAAAETVVDQAALAEAGVDFGAGTIGFRMAADKGQGRFRVQVNNPAVASSTSPFVVHVFEPNSDIALQLQARDNSFALGQTARFDLALTNGQALQADQLSGQFIAPDGRQVLPAEFVTGSDGIEAQVTLNGLDAWQPGLWELHTYYRSETGEQVVLRDAATAVAVNPGTARFSGHAIQQDDTLTWAVPVSARIPGRYDVRAVLYGTAADGQRVPVAVTQSAAWLNAGHGQIRVSVAAEHIADGIGAPFSLAQIQLSDQSRLARVDSR